METKILDPFRMINEDNIFDNDEDVQPEGAGTPDDADTGEDQDLGAPYRPEEDEEPEQF